MKFEESKPMHGEYMRPLEIPSVSYEKDGLKITRFFKCDVHGALEKELLGGRIYDFFKLKDERVYVDIGASIGIWTCDVSSRVSSSTIYSIEPHPDTFKNLLFNIWSNKHSNKIIPTQIAMSNLDGKRGIKLGIIEHNATFYSKHNAIVNTVTWDTFVRENNIDNVYLVKIDVEGAELLVFQGMTKCLPDCIAFAAYHHRGYDTAGREELITHLNGKGYYLPDQNVLADVSFMIRDDIVLDRI